MVAVDSGKRGGNATGLRIGRNGPAAVVTGGHDNGVPDAGGRWDRWPKGVRRQLAASSPPPATPDRLDPSRQQRRGGGQDLARGDPQELLVSRTAPRVPRRTLPRPRRGTRRRNGLLGRRSEWPARTARINATRLDPGDLGWSGDRGPQTRGCSGGCGTGRCSVSVTVPGIARAESVPGVPAMTKDELARRSERREAV
jgi:hypothetical protein